MWFWLCISVALVHVIATNSVKNVPTKNNNTFKEDAGAVFSDVIKNISRVNHILQELINNYEQLQKIYKSQEILDSQSSDSEVDEAYKNKMKQEGRERSKVQSPRTPRPDGFPATQMIWSDDVDEPSQADSSKSDSEAANSTYNHMAEKPQVEPIIPKHAEIIFVDTHQANAKKKKGKLHLEPKTEEIPSSTPPKTRYSKISHIELGSMELNERKSKKRKDRQKSYLRKEDSKENVNNSSELTTLKFNFISTEEPKKNVGKMLHSEFFSPVNIWDEIISNKPIQLEAHNELTLEKMRKDNNDNVSDPTAIHRSRDTKPELVMVSNQRHTLWKDKIKIPTVDSSETDEDAGREEFQATVLREAYGDACLKVVVKKCYKACKEAGKGVCERFKCKSLYKQKFTEFVKTGCIREFHGNTTLYAPGGENYIPGGENNEVIFRNDNTKGLNPTIATTRNSKEFDDLTRNGYLRSCLPHLQAGVGRSGEMLEEYSNKPSNRSELPKLNILRDKYERACQRISQEKCRAACAYASTNICFTYTCNESRKRSYKKQCKEKCKNAYNKGKNRYSSSGSSDSSDYSESESSGSGSGSETSD